MGLDPERLSLSGYIEAISVDTSGDGKKQPPSQEKMDRLAQIMEARRAAG